MRNEIISRRRLIEISQVHSDTKRILAVVSEVGPATNAKLLRGVDTAKIAKQVEEYSLSLQEQSNHFSDALGNKARMLCEKLKPDIVRLAEAATPDTKLAAGRDIYYSISAFISAAKSHADDQRENSTQLFVGQ